MLSIFSARKMTKNKQRKMSSGCPHLIGHAGIIGSDNRLYPLRMSKKYKTFLQALDRKRKAKVYVQIWTTSLFSYYYALPSD